MSSVQQRAPHPLPAERQTELAHAIRLEWLTLGLRISVVALLYLALGSTQTLTAVWLKSVWGLLPPVAFLTATRLERRSPSPRFPYGFHRAGSIAFLGSALALTCMGLFLLFAGLHGLILAQRPQLADILHSGAIVAWAGWPMMGALLYSIAVPFVNGGPRKRLAIDLHDKGLYADATMGRVSWLAGSAAIGGIALIGLGLWWADFLATLIIGGDILWHGFRHLRTAACDLIDEVPRRIGSPRTDPLVHDIQRYLESLAWVASARVRLREEGRLLTGMALLCPEREAGLLEHLDEARTVIQSMDWRLLDFQLVPVGRHMLSNIDADLTPDD